MFLHILDKITHKNPKKFYPIAFDKKYYHVLYTHVIHIIFMGSIRFYVHQKNTTKNVNNIKNDKEIFEDNNIFNGKIIFILLVQLDHSFVKNVNRFPFF